jgi:hypothetical protein
MTAIQKTIIGAALVAAIGTAVLLHLRTEPSVPTPDPTSPPANHPEDAEERTAGPYGAPSAAHPEASTKNARHTNLAERLLRGEEVEKLTAEQISAYLEANHRNAESLLAAARATGDSAYLTEAKERFPNDPRVQFAAIFKSDSPEERRQWLDRLEQTAPDNPLPDYLSALDDLKAGRTAQGVQELTAAAGKTGFQDYALDSIQSAEDAYRSAGYSEADAKLIAAVGVALPQLHELKQLSSSIVDLANSYRQAGDSATQQAVLQMALQMGQQLDPSGPGGQFLIDNVTGIAIQLDALKAMDPASAYDSSGQTVQNYIDQITQQRATFRQLITQTENYLCEQKPPEDQIGFLDRAKFQGELAAIQWYLAKTAQPSASGHN